jgi:hypothetical protein
VFSLLSGYSPEVLRTVPMANQKRVMQVQNLLALVALILCSSACGALVYQMTSSVLATVLFGFIVLALLVVLQGFVITATGMAITHPFTAMHKWKPKIERSWLFVVWAVVFSQPILLAGFVILLPQKASEASAQMARLQLEASMTSLDVAIGKMQGQIAVETEFLARLSSRDGMIQRPASAGARLVGQSLHRKALLIGNQAYPTSPLNNPRKDAQDLGRKLREVGFEVSLILDGKENDIAIAVDRYVQSLTPEDISFFYFSGHGFQSKGNNYLVPTDFTGLNPLQAVSLNGVVEAIASKHPVASIVVVDACRSYSYGGGGGLALTEAGENTFLAFAAKPGQTAQDGPPNSNGIFTAALLKYIFEPLEVDAMFRSVRIGVAELTRNTQQTWQAHNLKYPVVLPASAALSRTNTAIRKTSVRFDPSEFSGYSGVDICISKAANMARQQANSLIRSCVEARILRMKDDIAELRSNAALEPENEGVTASPMTSLHLAYTAMWREGLYSFIATVLLSFVLVFPFLWRERNLELVRAYEQHKMDANRDAITRAHGVASVSLREMKIQEVDSRVYLPELDFEPPFEQLDPREDPYIVDRTRAAFEALYHRLQNPSVGVAT